MKSEKWCTKPLRELISFISRGITPKYSDDKENSIVVLNQKCNRNNKIDLSFARYNSLDKKKVSEERILKKYDILINSTGTGTAGRVAQIKDVFEDMTVDSHMIILRNNDLIVPQYLGYALIKNQRIIESLAEGSTGQTEINKQRLLDEILISYPINKEEQKAIASILSALDDKIALNQQINNNLEQQAQAIFKSWFVDFEPFGGIVPKDWEEIEFSNFLLSRSEKSSDSSLKMFSVTDNGIQLRDEKFKKNLSKSNTKNKLAYQNDLIFGMSREILNWGILRYPVGGVSSAYNVYKVDDKINSFYLESYIKANILYFKDLIKPASREGQSIDKNALMKKILLLPPKKIINEYYEIENTLTYYIKHCKEEIQRLANIRDTLLPKLMSGELDISNIEF